MQVKVANFDGDENQAFQIAIGIEIAIDSDSDPDSDFDPDLDGFYTS